MTTIEPFQEAIRTIMENTFQSQIIAQLNRLNIFPQKEVHFNLNIPDVTAQAICGGEGVFSSAGALVVDTSPYTGRSPEDKYIVETDDSDIWLASGTKKLERPAYQALRHKMCASMGAEVLYVRDVLAGADPAYSQRIRVVTDLAWHSMAAANMFLPSDRAEPHPNPDFTLLVSTRFAADPERDGVRSPAFIILDFKEKLVLIATTRYAGEIKKSVFTLMNYVLPKLGVLSLHCSANKAPDGQVALFFGLSGTGKTTLSSDPERALIGDDEHGWSDSGVFNIEGGCYAKTIRINPKHEPLIWSAINRFGALLENVPLTSDQVPDFNSDSITENTRASYPLRFIENYDPSGMGGHPSHIFFLTADAFGVLPPLAKLTTEQAMYYFLSGYTSKLAGTERGLGNQPQATFSTCFGAPFLPLRPAIYADLLSKKLERFNTQVWLLNTGWLAGGFGVGERISLPLTRAMVSGVLSGAMDDVPTHLDPIFNLAIPDAVPGVPSRLLDPQNTWSDPSEYQQAARQLAEKFHENFKKYQDTLPESVVHSGPRIN